MISLFIISYFHSKAVYANVTYLIHSTLSCISLTGVLIPDKDLV